MLSFEQAPPISASFRFFLTAPWFGVAAGLLLAWEGPTTLSSRWTPAALALTHLLTTGFMLQAMCGALLQFIPVATGANIWRPLAMANLVHPALLAATLALTYSLATSRTEFLPAAELLFGFGLGAFCILTAIALFHTAATGVSLVALRVALGGLAMTTALGLLLAQALRGAVLIDVGALIDLHAAWGLLGWGWMLLAGVSFTVVPMFQVTPPYPSWMPRWLAGALGLTLAAASIAAFAAMKVAWTLAISLALLLAVAFACITLGLQFRRRRARTDASFAFSRGAMILLIGAGLGATGSAVCPAIADSPWTPGLLGVSSLVGVFVSAISGMLYKIVPFVAALQLPHQSDSTLAPPSIKTFITERSMAAQMRLHFFALALLLAAVLVPDLARVAGLVFALSCAWLGANLIHAALVYRQLKDRIRADAALRGSRSAVPGR